MQRSESESRGWSGGWISSRRRWPSCHRVHTLAAGAPGDSPPFYKPSRMALITGSRSWRGGGASTAVGLELELCPKPGEEAVGSEGGSRLCQQPSKWGSPGSFHTWASECHPGGWSPHLQCLAFLFPHQVNLGRAERWPSAPSKRPTPVHAQLPRVQGQPGTLTAFPELGSGVGFSQERLRPQTHALLPEESWPGVSWSRTPLGPPWDSLPRSCHAEMRSEAKERPLVRHKLGRPQQS